MAVKIFFCYAREDEMLLNKLRAHLAPLQRQGLVDTWHDRNISAGSEWEQEINLHLNAAQIILLLISVDFMNSDYCYSIEMKRALERHRQGKARVIPVILRPAFWEIDGIELLQALPKDAKPIVSWPNPEEALLDITQGLLKIVKEFTSRVPHTIEETDAKKATEDRPVSPKQAEKRDDASNKKQQEQLPRAYQRVDRWIVGIDLGTTNSCIAVMEDGEPVIIPNAEGSRTTPSMVAVNKNGERLVGEAAKTQAVTNPENTVYSIKRFMGRKFNDPEVQREKRLVPYNVVRASNGDAWVELQGKQYSPPEISAMILQKLKTDAENYLGGRVTQAVITVPAYFNDAQRQATKVAGQIAGLEVMRMINEPTAASLAYGLDRKQDEHIAVYDLGGGTFDISILGLEDGCFEVKSTNGDTHLGGDDFDQRIINWLADDFQREHGIDLRQDRIALQRLKEAAEKAKKGLSNSMTTEVNLPFIAADAIGPKHLNMSLTRGKLEQLVETLVEKSRDIVTNALADGNAAFAHVNEVILVGGQTRMPAVQELVRHIFDRKPNRGINPDEVVAIGAAVQAGVLNGAVKDVLLLDVTPFSLGIETLGGVFTRLIERNTTIPTQKTRVFSTASDSQPSVEINVLQGEREFAKDSRSLGHFILDGIPPAPRGTPQIEVCFDMDTNGILNVSAHDKDTGRKQTITIASSSGLSKDQIDKMIREAEFHAADDKRRKAVAEERNLADSVAYRVEKRITQLDKTINEELKSELETKIASVRTALTTNDVQSIKAARKSLEQSLHKISEATYL